MDTDKIRKKYIWISTDVNVKKINTIKPRALNIIYLYLVSVPEKGTEVARALCWPFMVQQE